MKTRPYLGYLYLMKENEEKHTRDIIEALVSNIEENIDINIQKNEKFE